MRVLLDATSIPSDRGGVGRYIDEILPALARNGAELVVATQPRDMERFASLVPGAELVPGPPAITRRAARLAWEQVGLARLARRVHADVLHSPHYTAPAFAPIPSVVTLHDATFFSHPELHSRAKGAFFRAATRLAVRRASALVVPSAATRDEVLRYAGGSQESFFVAHHGVDSSTFHAVDDTERSRVASVLGLDGRRYIAFLGTLEPRKNVPALIRAWVDVARGMVDPPALVLAGGPGWDANVEPAIAAVPAGLTLIRAGYLPLGDLPGFLSGALLVAYPSLGEGFGLPVLEAMACGAAVLTSRELSLPEVGGDAVAYADTDDQSIARALRRLLADSQERARLAGKASRRANEFTWDAAAKVHVCAYGHALARAGWHS